jgi:hypothetical protein
VICTGGKDKGVSYLSSFPWITCETTGKISNTTSEYNKTYGTSIFFIFVYVVGVPAVFWGGRKSSRRKVLDLWRAIFKKKTVSEYSGLLDEDTRENGKPEPRAPDRTSTNQKKRKHGWLIFSRFRLNLGFLVYAALMTACHTKFGTEDLGTGLMVGFSLFWGLFIGIYESSFVTKMYQVGMTMVYIFGTVVRSFVPESDIPNVQIMVPVMVLLVWMASLLAYFWEDIRALKFFRNLGDYSEQKSSFEIS